MGKTLTKETLYSKSETAENAKKSIKSLNKETKQATTKTT